jgi:hypothetical protein
MKIILPRQPTMDTKRGRTTFGEMFLEDGTRLCQTLEDEIREDPDLSTPQNEDKVYGETCFPAGEYELRFRDSPHFGPESIEVVDVPGYKDVLIHGGIDVGSTLGCVIVGDIVNKIEGTIAGAKLRGVLERIKDVLREAFARKERVFLEVRNP